MSRWQDAIRKEINLPIKSNKKYLCLAWTICALGAVFYSYEYFLRISPSVMVSSLRRHYGLQAEGFGMLSATYYYAYVLMQIPVGILMDRYGPRRLLSLACAICVLGTILFTATQWLWVAVIGRFLVGFGSAFAFVGVLKLATLWLPEDKLAMVSGLAAALGTMGAMLGDNLLGHVVAVVGWAETLYYTAFFGFILVFVLWFGLRSSSAKPLNNQSTLTMQQSIEYLKIIVKNRQIWLNGFYGCLVYLPTTVIAELWGIPHLQMSHGLSDEVAQYSNSLIFLGFTLGAPLMGLLSDKLHRRKAPMLLGAVGAFVMASLLLFVPGWQLHQIQFLLFALGLFYSSQAIVFAVGRELSPANAAGTAMAMTNMLVMLGGMIIQPLVGYLLDFSALSHLSITAGLSSLSATQLIYTAVDFRFALSIVPVGILIAAILTFFLKETHASMGRKHA